MEISYKGGNGMVFTTKKTTLLVDPNVSILGLKNPSVADAVELITDERFELAGSRLTIDTPGEYEVGEFSIRGVAARRATDPSDSWLKSTIYRVETPDFRIALIGNIDKKLSEEQYEAIGVVDILVIPVGGNGYTLDPHDAATITRQIDPRVVIPVHFEDSAVKYEVPALPLEQFTKELRLTVENVDKYKLKNASSLPEVLSIVSITRS